MIKLLKTIRIRYRLSKMWRTIPINDRKKYLESYEEIKKYHSKYFNKTRMILCLIRDCFAVLIKYLIMFLLPLVVSFVFFAFNINLDYIDFTNSLSFIGISVTLFSSSVVAILIASSVTTKEFFGEKPLFVFLQFRVAKIVTPSYILIQCIYNILLSVVFINFNVISSLIDSSISILYSMILFICFVVFSCKKDIEIFEIYALEMKWFIRTKKRTFYKENHLLMNNTKYLINDLKQVPILRNNISSLELCYRVLDDIECGNDYSRSLRDLNYFIKIIPVYIRSYYDIYSIILLSSYLEKYVFKPLIGINRYDKLLMIYDSYFFLMNTLLKLDSFSMFFEIKDFYGSNTGIIYHKTICNYVIYYNELSAVAKLISGLLLLISESTKNFLIIEKNVKETIYEDKYRRLNEMYSEFISKVEELNNKSLKIESDVKKFMNDEKELIDSLLKKISKDIKLNI